MTPEEKDSVAQQIFGNLIRPKVCCDLDEDCFQMTEAQVQACEQYDRTCGLCPMGRLR